MAIIVKGNVQDGTNQPALPVETPMPPKRAKVLDHKTIRSSAEPAPKPVIEQRAPIQNEPQQKYVRSYPRRYYHADEHLLVVGGKEKKIGKQSKYLLDMLTIEE